MPKTTMTAVVFDEPASESDGFAALTTGEVPMPDHGAGTVVVRTALAPINPSDLLFASGRFPGPARLAFPKQVAGISGAGHLASNEGSDAERLFHYTAFGTWAEYVSVPEESLIELPKDYPLELAAQFSNVVTAWQLVEKSGVRPGQWLALTAGYSTVALIALQFAARKGINVLSVVRRRRPRIDLAAHGAAAVVVPNEAAAPLSDIVLETTHGQGLSGVADCVAGRQLGELIRSCAPFSRVLLYGCLDESDLGVTGPEIMYSFVNIEPYSYPFTFDPPRSDADQRMLRAVIKDSADGQIAVDTAGKFPLENFRDALDGHVAGNVPGKFFLAANTD